MEQFCGRAFLVNYVIEVLLSAFCLFRWLNETLDYARSVDGESEMIRRGSHSGGAFLLT